MLNRFFGNNTHSYLHVLGIAGIAFALPWSKVMMSISVMFIILNLLLEGAFSSYWKNFKANRVFWLVVAVYLLNVIGLFWSTNTSEALHAIKQQLPFIAIPTALVAKPILETKHRDIIFLTFLVAMLGTSLYNFLSYQHIIGNRFYDDIRGMSLTSSHIRYSLLISMSAGITLVCSRGHKKRLIFCLILLAWFAFYTFYSQVISGVISFAAMLTVFALYHLWMKNKSLALLFSGAAIVLGMIPIVWLLQPLEIDPADYASLPKMTKQGNPYNHNLSYVDSETHEPILIYVNEDEMREEWEKRSELPYDGITVRGNLVSHTLMRYLSTKRLPRDAEGVSKLSANDIRNIELGRPSVHHTGLMARMHALRFELNYAVNPNGHSLLQRFEYWKAAWQLIKSDGIIGVGTGDVQDAFNHYYESSSSPLSEQNRRRAHNQFLTYWISFGILGLALFVALLFAFMRLNWHKQKVLALLFGAIVISSFFMEDTLETQTGVTFFALFTGLFLSKAEQNATKEPAH